MRIWENIKSLFLCFFKYLTMPTIINANINTSPNTIIKPPPITKAIIASTQIIDNNIVNSIIMLPPKFIPL